MAISYIDNMQDNRMKELNWRDLYQADRTLAVPFQLDLGDHEEPVYCDEVVRVIPGKRLVLFGVWCGESVVAKLFYEPRNAKRHFKRELAGIESLTAANIPTPKLLYKGTAKNKRIQVLLFERIMEAKNLEEIWRERHSHHEMSRLMAAVTLELATQHVLGIVQRDLHLKNVLIKGKKIYTLDGGSIECTNEILAKKPSLDHLALFFSQLGAGTDTLREKLFEIYIKSRGWLLKKSDIDFFHEAIEKWDGQRWLRYQKKITRNCTAFVRMKKRGALIMYDRDYQSATLLNLLTHPESAFSQPGVELLKTGRSSTVAKIMIDGQPFVIKRYNVKDTWHWLRRCFRSTRAAASWQLAHLLRLFGIPTAKPIAFIENRFMGLRGTSYFLMEYIDGENLGNYFANYHEDEDRFIIVAERVVALLKNLAKLRISHGDLKAANILVKDEAPVLIDLDGVIMHDSNGETKRGFRKEVARFMQNWEKLPKVRKLFEKLIG